ncbi:MAG TPA: HigA family addiction module antitoxin [Clostridia bacterium]|jgi:HTH-type transcriptional regulator/antitoxin HigA|nr:HigA family addiction module antidote protein [Clostridia bacterium]NLV33778.1 HigA family addiction module antidote protein [Clostridiaceae bacterium]HQM96477.1 HigA family addiction module antitoxin [Clostridia bacterium]
MLHSKNIIAIPPGMTIREQLEIRGMSQKEFAKRMDISEKHISHLINGKVELTYDVAYRLESVLGIPQRFWLNLEMLYREQITQVESENDMEKDEEIVKKIPYAMIASMGWVPKTKKSKEKVINLRKFFEVAKLNVLENICIPGIAYKSDNSNAITDYSLAVWAQKARIEGRKLNVLPINIPSLREKIPHLRALTVMNPSDSLHKLTEILANCGIAAVFLPQIGGSFRHGASFIDGKHIVLGLTSTGKDADKFWVHMFHEIYHIIEGHITLSEKSSLKKEEAADDFARDTLINRESYYRFCEKNDFTKKAIKKFAEEIGITPGIVLGRLQEDNKVPVNCLNELKEQYLTANN